MILEKTNAKKIRINLFIFYLVSLNVPCSIAHLKHHDNVS